MKLLYWLIKFMWYFAMSVIATTYWKGYGWWFLAICAVVLPLGDGLIGKFFKKTNFKPLTNG